MDCLQANTIYQGCALELARRFRDQTPVVQAVVTSPPYFGHRVYSDSDSRELGRESTVSDYVERLVETLDALRPLVVNDGVLWLNLGDTYRNGVLQSVPWRVALAMQDRGWLLRSDVIWHKPNAMPSAASRRPTVDHEYLFLFSKSRRYFYDADAVREPHVTFSEHSRMRGGRKHFGIRHGTPESGKLAGQINMHNGRWDQAFHPRGRNRRTVWSVPLGKCREAHFAVFPERLVEPCILSTVPPQGLVLDPFMGAGTTACVAMRHGRRYIGFELVPEYVALAKRRIAAVTAS
ncbi:MAG: site-specific DNA-methyltransferase [Planctomycetales bacterium]|nr:site-specific DNA-methyltransferase [Planctomycetales bacterium]